MMASSLCFMVGDRNEKEGVSLCFVLSWLEDRNMRMVEEVGTMAPWQGPNPLSSPPSSPPPSVLVPMASSSPDEDRAGGHAVRCKTKGRGFGGIPTEGLHARPPHTSSSPEKRQKHKESGVLFCWGALGGLRGEGIKRLRTYSLAPRQTSELESQLAWWKERRG